MTVSGRPFDVAVNRMNDESCEALERRAIRHTLHRLSMLTALVGCIWFSLAAFARTWDPYRVFATAHADVLSDWEPNMRFAKARYLIDVRASPDRPNAFVFGSSDAGAFRTRDLDDWSSVTTRFYNYAVSSESVRGIRLKLEFLRANHYEIRTALVVLRRMDLITQPTPRRREHHAVSGEHPLVFEWFYLGLLTHGLEDSLYQILRNRRGDAPRSLYRIRTGDHIRVDLDDRIEREGRRYYEVAEPALLETVRTDENRSLLWTRPRRVPPLLTSPPHLAEFRRIAALLRAMGAETHVLLWGHRPFGPDALAAERLREIFGHVHDFAAVTAETRNVFNFYDASHYRPSLARWMTQSAFEAHGHLPRTAARGTID